MIDPNLVELFHNLTLAVADPTTSHGLAYSMAQQAYQIVDATVGIKGQPQYDRLPYESIAAFHSALVENHLDHQPTSDLAERLWHRATGSPKQGPSLLSGLANRSTFPNRGAFLEIVGGV
jgi:hypothetical protein